MLGVMNVEYAPERSVTVVRVLIVDDLDLWHGFVVARLQEQPDARIVGFASDGLSKKRRSCNPI